jgi:hypothetical protein
MRVICGSLSRNNMPFVPPSDYTITRQLGENNTTSIWLAEQVSVRRNVVLEQLRYPDTASREEFIAAVRAKASVDHPLIASVYEAINEAEYCFFAREWLPGDNLSTLMTNGVTMRPAQLAHIIKRIAEASMHLEERSTATDVITASHIYLNEQKVLRLSNLAKPGPRAESASKDDQKELGITLLPLVEAGSSGYTRIQTLLHWMTGADPEHQLPWSEIRHYADQIEQQLAAPVTPLQPPTPPTQPRLVVVKKKSPLPIIVTVAAVCLLVLVIFLVTRPKEPTAPAQVIKNTTIEVPAGSYTGPDGDAQNIRKFWMSAHEVTIGQYREFLDALKVLNEEDRKLYDHESQPPKKSGHEPDEWDAVIAAAEKGQVWRDRKLSLLSPVFGVDWWDAHAYCEWKRARLPTQEEWHAALRLLTGDPLTLKPAGWNDVYNLEKNGAGFLGMAGGVSEWTRKPASDPSNPLGAKLWVVIGASFAKTSNGALAREWTNDRDLRRDDLGFRIAYDHLPD